MGSKHCPNPPLILFFIETDGNPLLILFSAYTVVLKKSPNTSHLLYLLSATRNTFVHGTVLQGPHLEVLGLINPPYLTGDQCSWAIMGGTGVFTNAHGTINYKDVQSTVSSITDVVRELDIHIFYTP
uniref:Dirigent protein n=1 Tax=Setaria viridis TaxID=4556 RepID=A0A4U6SZX8_SETVI|nr:hypothetical protein SEVIR_9G262500v2 [Setaria viridis]